MKSDLRILGYLGVCEWHAGSVWTANHQSQPLFIRLSNKAEPALKNKMRTSTKLLTSFFIHTSPFKHSYSSYLEKSPEVFSNIVQLSKKRSVTDCVQLWKLVEQTGSDIMNQEFISDMKSAKHLNCCTKLQQFMDFRWTTKFHCLYRRASAGETRCV